MDIRTKLILDNRDFNRGIDQSQNKSKGFSNSFVTMARTAKIAVGAIAAATGAITALAKRVSDAGAGLRDLSRSLGISAKFIQQFRFAAEQNSVAMESADRALEQFSRRLGEAARGTGEARKTLTEMGVSVRDSNGRFREAQDILADVADAFQNNTDATRNADRANQLFGRSGIELISVLRGGSRALREFGDQADRLGALTDAEVITLGKLSDSYTDLATAIRGVVNQFVLGLEPALKASNKELTEMLANNQELARTMGEGVGEALRRIGDVAVLLANNIELIRNAFLALIGVRLASSLQSIIARFSSATTGAKGFSGVISGVVAASRTLVGVIGAKLLAFTKFGIALAIVTGAFSLLSGRTIQLNDTTTTFSEILSAVLFKITELIKGVGRLAKSFAIEFEPALEAIQAGFGAALSVITGFVNFTIAAFNIVPRTAKLAFDQVRRVISGEGVDAIQEYQDLIMNLFATDFVGNAADTVRGFLQSIVEDYRAAQQSTRQPLRITIDGGTAEQVPEMLTGWRLALQQFVEGFQQGFKEFKDSILTNTQLGLAVFKRFSEGLTDSLTDFFMTGKLNMRSFLEDIVRMIVRSNIQQALAAAFGGIGAASGIFGSIFGAIGSAFSGGAAGPLTGGTYAIGGMIPAGQTGLVGERGPEFIRGPAQITPVKQSDMRSQPTQVNYYIEAIDTQSFQDRLAQDPEFVFGVTQRGSRSFA